MLSEDIMKVNVDNLSKLQVEFLKGHLVETLNKIINYVQEDNYDEIRKMLEYSSGGDLGDENYFINFGYLGKTFDINNIINMIEGLKLEKKW